MGRGIVDPALAAALATITVVCAVRFGFGVLAGQALDAALCFAGALATGSLLALGLELTGRG
jgi:hypothetical protein